MKLLGLDPGGVTGFGVIEIEGRDLSVLDYGVVPIPSGQHALVALWNWLSGFAETQRADRVAFEELLDTKGKTPDYCPRDAKEARGVIRLFVESRGIPYTSYHPATIKAVFRAKKKVDVRAAVSGMIGLSLRGYPDHVSDALAVALVYASRELGWAPMEVDSAAIREASARPRRQRKADKYDGVDFSNPANKHLLREAIVAGLVRPKRR